MKSPSKKLRLIKETLCVLALATPAVAAASSHRETAYTRNGPQAQAVQGERVPVLRVAAEMPRARF